MQALEGREVSLVCLAKGGAYGGVSGEPADTEKYKTAWLDAAGRRSC